ncbi:hypothetical protein HDU76_007487 [Blyttiomyces sp. JEL0837]|nr:hypothetical protein HDU76_007487 [Blyttiomyces sp. JEL0837]
MSSQPSGWEKVVGITLALLSGVLIGSSVVFTRKGLKDAKARGFDARKGSHGYLKIFSWWVGMTLMGLGEVANFGAYAFVPAILVTPLGALSVVVSAILSAIFLKERLSFSGRVGCAQCIIGAVIIVFHAPAQSVTQTIGEFFSYVVSPVFLVYSAVVLGAIVYIIWYLEPRTQGFGAAVVYSVKYWSTDNQFLKWQIYPLFVFIVFTIIFQIHYLNKGLSTFTSSVVAPIYYVTFTTTTLVSSAFLFRGFPVDSVSSGITIVLGFVVIVGGVALLFQYSLSVDINATDPTPTSAFSSTIQPGEGCAEDSRTSGFKNECDCCCHCESCGNECTRDLLSPLSSGNIESDSTLSQREADDQQQDYYRRHHPCQHQQHSNCPYGHTKGAIADFESVDDDVMSDVSSHSRFALPGYPLPISPSASLQSLPSMTASPRAIALSRSLAACAESFIEVVDIPRSRGSIGSGRSSIGSFPGSVRSGPPSVLSFSNGLSRTSGGGSRVGIVPSLSQQSQPRMAHTGSDNTRTTRSIDGLQIRRNLSPLPFSVRSQSGGSGFHSATTTTSKLNPNFHRDMDQRSHYGNASSQASHQPHRTSATGGGAQSTNNRTTPPAPSPLPPVQEPEPAISADEAQSPVTAIHVPTLSSSIPDHRIGMFFAGMNLDKRSSGSIVSVDATSSLVNHAGSPTASPLLKARPPVGVPMPSLQRSKPSPARSHEVSGFLTSPTSTSASLLRLAETKASITASSSTTSSKTRIAAAAPAAEPERMTTTRSSGSSRRPSPPISPPKAMVANHTTAASVSISTSTKSTAIMADLDRPAVFAGSRSQFHDRNGKGQVQQQQIGKLEDLTPPLDDVGRPMTAAFAGSSSAGIESGLGRSNGKNSMTIERSESANSRFRAVLAHHSFSKWVDGEDDEDDDEDED